MKAVLGAFGVLSVLVLAACGGRAKDTTHLSEPPVEPESVDAPRSAALDALAEPAARAAFCGWVGASAASIAGRVGTPLDCSRVTEQCSQAASDAARDGSLDVASSLLGASGDLEAVLGCPVSLDELDSCVAQLIQLSVSRYPDGPGCGASAAPVEPLGVRDLAMLDRCLVVVADCPELLRQLLAAGG